MNKAQLLEENARLRYALYRPERSRFTQLRADLINENREMQEELDNQYYGRAVEPKPPRKVKRKLRASRRLRALTWPREKS